MTRISVLATDMDGTFIPLEGNDENRRDLDVLCEELRLQELDLVYVTGRHYELVLDAIESHALPKPRWLICDVGTSIYEDTPDRGHRLLQAYVDHLANLVRPVDVQTLATQFSEITALTIQEPEKQGRFKLSYYCDANLLPQITHRLSGSLENASVPCCVIASVDPFSGEGLIDLVPKDVSKAYALHWWADHNRRDPETIVFAGDSGNDLAALTAGYRSIVVGNADLAVANQVHLAHQSAGWTDRLFLAPQPATSGVLAGLRHFCASNR